MEASPDQRPSLKLVDPATGELVDPSRCPHCETYQAEAEEITRKFKGALLEIRRLKADREGEIMAAPERPLVELLHAAWKVGCNRRRELHWADRERMTYAVRRLGFALCLRALAGAAYDPNYSPPRKNGKRDRFDDLELIFRETAKVHQFAERAPNSWQPKPDKLAALGGVPVEFVREQLEQQEGAA